MGVVSLDLSKAHFSRHYGDLVAVLSWMNDKRALFLIAHLRKGTPWFIIPEETAWEWSDQDPDNFDSEALTKLARSRAIARCRQMGVEPTPDVVAYLVRRVTANAQHVMVEGRAATACDVLGIEPSAINVRRIIGIVNDLIPELNRMPSAPLPDILPGSYGAMELREDGKTLTHREIQLEDEGVAYGPV